MTGRQKIINAVSQEGSKEIPCVICYEGVFIRDHWGEINSYPWWYMKSPDIEKQILCRSETMSKIRQDWFLLPEFYSKEERRNYEIEIRKRQVYLKNKKLGTEKRIARPKTGGHFIKGGKRTEQTTTIKGIDEIIAISEDFNPEQIVNDGRADLAFRLLKGYGQKLFPIIEITSPLWSCFKLWGFEEMMIMIATKPDLVRHACKRYLKLRLQNILLAAEMGVKGIFIEECMSDLIGPEAFKSLSIPFTKRLVEEIKALNLKSIYYFTGNPAKVLQDIIATGTDAIAFEESKKGFSIDIEDIIDEVRGKCTVFGNLDPVDILQKGSEEQLRSEITRQITAGRRNGSRFVMSTGSPVTPSTPLERVQLYVDLVHELGK